MSERLYTYVDCEETKSGDLYLEHNLNMDGVKNMLTQKILSLEEKATKEWLQLKGWASPEEKAELIEVMEELVEVWADSVDYSQPGEYKRYLKIIARSKGEQG